MCYVTLLYYYSLLKDTERFLSGHSVNGSLVSDNIEADRLAERTALSNSDNITILHVKGWRAVNSNVLVPLLETSVLGNVVQVVSANDNGSLHLGGNHQSLENATTNRDAACKGALLVNVVSFHSLVGSLKSKTNRLCVTHGLLVSASNHALACHKNGILALVGLFVLIALNVLLWNARRHDSTKDKSENLNKKEDEKVRLRWGLDSGGRPWHILVPFRLFPHFTPILLPEPTTEYHSSYMHSIDVNKTR